VAELKRLALDMAGSRRAVVHRQPDGTAAYPQLERLAGFRIGVMTAASCGCLVGELSWLSTAAGSGACGLLLGGAFLAGLLRLGVSPVGAGGV